MSTNRMKFAIAQADAAAAAKGDDYHLTEFELPGKPGEPTQLYAAVRPVEGAFMMVVNVVARARQDTKEQIVAVLQFLDACLNETDLRAALIETGNYGPVEDDVIRDDDLSDAGVELMKSNTRLYGRLMDRSDPLGPETLAQVMTQLVEAWSGNPTGLPEDYLPSRKRTGASSTAKRSPKGSTSRKTSAAPRRGSSPRSTTTAREG